MRTLVTAAIIALGVCATPAVAQDYPNKPIRLIVPFAPGGPTDLTGRIVADALSQRLGQSVVVENKPGAGTAIGHDLVAKSRPDGYTLVLATSDGLSILPAVKPTMPYRIPDDFTFVSAVAKSTLVLAVHGKLPFKSLSELVAYGKANPGKLRYGTSGVGGGAHLASELIAKTAGIETVHVPYAGSAPVVTAAVGGFVDFILAGTSTIKPYADAGTLRVLAVIDKDRHRLLPEVPTLEQAGLRDLNVILYLGVLGPAGMPEPIKARLEKELAAIVADPQVAERFRGPGLEPSYLGGDAFRDFLAKDLARWKDVAKAANIVLND